MKSHNKNEIKEILTRMNLTDDRMDQVTDDIERGTALLERYCAPEMPADVMDRVEGAINSQRRRIAVWRFGRVAALIAVIFSLVYGLLQLNQGEAIVEKPTDGQVAMESMTLADLADEGILWKLAYSQENDEHSIDTMVLSEVLIFWEDQEPVNEEPLGWQIEVDPGIC